MSDIHEIRRKNTQKLLANWDTRQEFADACSLHKSQVTQLVGNNWTNNIGTTIARRIEAANNKPRNWLDVDHDNESDLDMNLSIEVVLDCVTGLNTCLRQNNISPLNVNDNIYSELLRHLILVSIPLNKIDATQIQSALSLTGLAEVAN